MPCTSARWKGLRECWRPAGSALCRSCAPERMAGRPECRPCGGQGRLVPAVRSAGPARAQAAETLAGLKRCRLAGAESRCTCKTTLAGRHFQGDFCGAAFGGHWRPWASGSLACPHLRRRRRMALGRLAPYRAFAPPQQPAPQAFLLPEALNGRNWRWRAWSPCGFPAKAGPSRLQRPWGELRP